MNPEKVPPTPREEWEVRLTALLMGELPPEEAAAVRAWMAADPEPAALYERLRKAMELLWEASALPEPSAPPAPVQLSSERRERLLAHFKTAAPAPASSLTPVPIVEMPRRNWRWAVPMGLAAMLVVLLGVGMMRPVFANVRPKRYATLKELRARDGDDGFANEETWAPQPGTSNRLGATGAFSPSQKDAVPASPAAATAAPPASGSTRGLYLGGTTTAVSGTLALNSSIAPPTVVTANTGSVALTGAAPSAGKSSNGPVRIDYGVAIQKDQFATKSGQFGNDDPTVAVTTVTKSGAGTLNLTGANSYSGGTTFNAGTLALNGVSQAVGTLTGSGAKVIGGFGTVSEPPVLVGTATGSGGQTISGLGALSLNNGVGTSVTGSNIYTGATVISGGTLSVTGATGSNSAVTPKFAEVQQNNTRELNFDALGRQFGSPVGNVFAGGGTSGTSEALDSADFPFVTLGSGSVGTAPLTAGNRSGNVAISANAIDALLFPVAKEAPMDTAVAAPAAPGVTPSTPAAGRANSITLNGGASLSVTDPTDTFFAGTGGTTVTSTAGVALGSVSSSTGDIALNGGAFPVIHPRFTGTIVGNGVSANGGMSPPVIIAQLLQNEVRPDPEHSAAPSTRTPSKRSGGRELDTINPAGEPVRSADEKEELAEPQIQRLAEREKARRTDYEQRSREAKEAGDVAMKQKDYEKAAAYYKSAADIIPDAPETQALHHAAVGKFSDASTKLATQRITEGRYAEAQNTLRTVVDGRYDPKNKQAATILSRLEQPDYYNKTVDPKFRAKVEQVKQWNAEAQSFYDSGRFSLAKERAEQILKLDPYNSAARQFEEKVDRAVDDYGIAAYNETRANAIKDVDNAWARPVRKFNVEADHLTAIKKGSAKQSPAEINPVGKPARGDGEKEEVAPADTEEIRHKLASIIIPKIQFHDATVREALDFLKKKSVELDDASPAGEKGANIVLKLGDSAGGENGVHGAAAGLPGLAAREASAASAAPAAAPSPAEPRITVSLTNIPLIEALKYVTGVANLKFKVEPNAVSVMPLSEVTDVFVTKEWKIPADLIPPKPGGGTEAADRETGRNWLIANGVTFSGTAAAIYIPKNNRLIVRDTQDQIDLVDNIINESTKARAQEKMEQEAAKKKIVPSAAIPQPEIQTRENAFSTFSLNVADVSFKLAAASLEQGHMPDPSTVRSEEFINAFDYRDPEPAPGAPLAFAAERARYPFAQNRDLLRFSVKTAAAGRQPGRPLNIVLVLDKSGSMERADRVNIVREALRVLATQLQPQDQLSIVTFARTPRLWADGVPGNKVAEMIARVSEITPEGGTNLEAALDLGYETAHRHYAVGNINRVVLFTDGAANLGDVNPDELTKKVEAERKKGVALDCFGIGWEGYNDDLLEQLTRNGDGRYGFLNTPEEAAANFAGQLAGALRVAASDVKVQVEFNPRRVTAYRQIGYAKHQLTKEQFRDNSVAAAQIGAAESGNALYVVAVDPQGEGDLATVRVRFRVPGTSDYREHEWTVPFSGNVPPLEESSPALRLAGAAGAFSEMLATNPYAGEVTSDRLLGLLNGVPAVYGADPRPQKLEWMVHQARSLSGR